MRGREQRHAFTEDDRLDEQVYLVDEACVPEPHEEPAPSDEPDRSPFGPSECPDELCRVFVYERHVVTCGRQPAPRGEDVTVLPRVGKRDVPRDDLLVGGRAEQNRIDRRVEAVEVEALSLDEPVDATLLVGDEAVQTGRYGEDDVSDG